MMQWLYILKPARLGMVAEDPIPEEVEIVSRHFVYHSGITGKGVMILVGRTQNADENTIGLLYPYKIALQRGQTA